jgi:hypothetical protein
MIHLEEQVCKILRLRPPVSANFEHLLVVKIDKCDNKLGEAVAQMSFYGQTCADSQSAHLRHARMS